MDLKEKVALAEAEFGNMADSYAGILEQLRSRIPSALIDDSGWDQIRECAQEIPPTVATFPFGFEIPIHEQEARANFGVSVHGLSESAVYYKERGQSADANSPAAALAGLLRKMTTDAPVWEIVAPKMVLEYDVARTEDGTRPAPAIFIRPSERPIVGGSERTEDLGIVLETIFSGAGWDPTPEEVQQAVRVYRAQKDDSTRIGSFSVFPSGKRGVRLTVGSFQNMHEIKEFLERCEWSGETSNITSIVERLKEKKAFVSLGIDVDVTADGPEPTFGLIFAPKVRPANTPEYWIDRPNLWTPFFDCLRELNLAVPEKLLALADRTWGAERVLYSSGTLIILWLVHHVKFVVRQDQIEEVNAYPFFLMCPMGKDSKFFENLDFL